MIHAYHYSSYCGRGYITYNQSGVSETIIRSGRAGGGGGSGYNCTFKFENGSDSSSNVSTPSSINLHFTPNTTNQLTFKTRIMTSNSSNASVINNTRTDHTNSDDGGNTVSSLTFWEVAGAISTVSNTSMA